MVGLCIGTSITHNEVRFSRKQIKFLIHPGFDLMPHDLYFRSFHKPYFSKKHIFHKSHRVNITQDYGLKTCKQVPNYSTMS